jgi:hypothetical protein
MPTKKPRNLDQGAGAFVFASRSRVRVLSRRSVLGPAINFEPGKVPRPLPGPVPTETAKILSLKHEQ